MELFPLSVDIDAGGEFLNSCQFKLTHGNILFICKTLNNFSVYFIYDNLGALLSSLPKKFFFVTQKKNLWLKICIIER